MESSGETEGYRKGGVAATDYIAETVVINSFDAIAGVIGDQAQGTDLVVGEVVGGASLGHGIGDTVIGVFEALAQVPGSVVDRKEGGLVEPEVSFFYGAVRKIWGVSLIPRGINNNGQKTT
jgi:hypothetical protein